MKRLKGVNKKQGHKGLSRGEKSKGISNEEKVQERKG